MLFNQSKSKCYCIDDTQTALSLLELSSAITPAAGVINESTTRTNTLLYNIITNDTNQNEPTTNFIVTGTNPNTPTTNQNNKPLPPTSSHLPPTSSKLQPNTPTQYKEVERKQY